MTDKTDVVAAYFKAWDDHDTDAILATFNDGGTYSDPAAGAGLRGAAITAYAQSLFDAFPDLRLELICNVEASTGVIAAPWLLFGTHRGQLMGNAPTGKEVALPGCDFIAVSDGRIDSVQGLFDPAELMAQLGLATP